MEAATSPTNFKTLRRSTRKIAPNPRYLQSTTQAPAATSSARGLTGLGQGKSIPHHEGGHSRTSILRPVTSTPALRYSSASTLETLSPVRTTRTSKKTWLSLVTKARAARRLRSSANVRSPDGRDNSITDEGKWGREEVLRRVQGGWASQLNKSTGEQERSKTGASKSQGAQTHPHKQACPEAGNGLFEPEDGLIDIMPDQNGVHHIPQSLDGGVRKEYFSYSGSSPTRGLSHSMSMMSLGDLSLAGDAGEGRATKNISFVGSVYLGEDESWDKEELPGVAQTAEPVHWAPAPTRYEMYLARMGGPERRPLDSTTPETCVNPADTFQS
ncbi:uncharacterized protein EI90DRAFT_3116541 [Cantharellus anzutake]|uniref:uncharacterized protein n=1 Tax=Cantharellus anzutake TaxID=1750568 RepID=UPI001908E423|nr:uncharacterized protein EI90DRAFT_3116541 [Cantharellus anzutake]KAF8341401.1 hypothetical protein EI90DRAFT_3116541 [Cantharellus anzutake]